MSEPGGNQDSSAQAGGHTSIRRLSGWATFGFTMAYIHELGAAPVDLHRDNILTRPESGRPVMVDMGDFKRIDYPDDWELLPTALMSLLNWLEQESAAAFRFGYMTYGGPVARCVFDTLRRQNGINAFNEGELLYQPHEDAPAPVSLERIRAMDKRWRSERVLLRKKDFISRDPTVDALDEWRAERARRGQSGPSATDEFYYRKHLIAAQFAGSLYHTLEALLNLQGYFTALDRRFEAAGLARYCQALVSQFRDRISSELIAQVDETARISWQRVGREFREQLEILPLDFTVFRYIWSIEDSLVGIITRDPAGEATKA